MDYLIHAPGLGYQTMSFTESFGAAVWLAMQSHKVKDIALHHLNGLILQAKEAHSEVLICLKDDKGGWTPHLWLSYARLSAEVEKELIRNPSVFLQSDQFHSGDRLWALYLIAPLGFDRRLILILKQLFAGHSARGLSPNSHWRGLQVLIWRAWGCSQAQSLAYWKQRPLLAS